MIDNPNLKPEISDTDVALWQNEAADFKKILLEINPAEFKESASVEDKHRLFLCYQKLVLFPDDDIIQRLRNCGLKPIELRWFIDHKKIIAEMNRINNSGKIRIAEPLAFFFIRQHLEVKVNQVMAFHFMGVVVYDQLPVTKIRKYFIDLFKRNSNESLEELVVLGTKTGLSYFDQLMLEEFIMKVKAFKNIAEAKKILLKLLSGDTDHNFIRMLYDCVYRYDNVPISQRQAHCIIYELFRLVLKDKHLLTEDEFLDQNIYDGCFDTYRNSKIKKVIAKT